MDAVLLLAWQVAIGNTSKLHEQAVTLWWVQYAVLLQCPAKNLPHPEERQSNHVPYYWQLAIRHTTADPIPAAAVAAAVAAGLNSHWSASGAHRSRLWALHCLVLAGVPPPGPLPAVCVQALLPHVALTAWAQRYLVLVHHELMSPHFALAYHCAAVHLYHGAAVAAGGHHLGKVLLLLLLLLGDGA